MLFFLSMGSSWIQSPAANAADSRSPNAFSPGIWFVLAGGVWAVALFALWRSKNVEHQGLAAALTLGGISIATAIEVARVSGSRQPAG
jgi:hypothetical protein